MVINDGRSENSQECVQGTQEENNTANPEMDLAVPGRGLSLLVLGMVHYSQSKLSKQ